MAAVNVTNEPPLSVEPQPSVSAEPPLLVAQLERAIDYCQQYTKDGPKLSWQIDDSLEQVEFIDTQLTLPSLTKVFASAKLKQQFWHHIYHTKK